MNWKLVAQIAVPLIAAVVGVGAGTQIPQVATPIKQDRPVVVHCDCPKIPACPSLTVDGFKK